MSDWVSFSKRVKGLEAIHDDSELSKIHKGRLHQLSKEIQETQGEISEFV